MDVVVGQDAYNLLLAHGWFAHKLVSSQENESALEGSGWGGAGRGGGSADRVMNK